MRTLSRALRRWEPLRVAVVAVALAILIILAAYVVAVATSSVTAGGAVSALGMLAIAGAGLLYAWRLGAGGSVD